MLTTGKINERERARGILQAVPVRRVLFVCLGNICRSPSAQGVLQAIVDARGDTANWHIDSAGTGNYHTGDLPDRRMRVHATRRGYDLTHHARQVRESDFDDFDLIVGMDDYNLETLHRLAPTPEAAAKIVPMSAWFDIATRYDYVPDPYYEGAEGFELVLDLLENGCANMADDASQLKKS
ncbi:MAG: low molecular weight phosphotyrosine protein phosphatase [Muribaculaceae bacterium]|nr:low molecular weight phosphotyrosine protein phosphatase [Muribaculaceae bacterium]